MKHWKLLFAALFNILIINNAIGQPIEVSASQASPNISSCTDPLIIELAKNNWSKLDTVHMLGVAQSSASLKSNGYPEPSKWEWVAFQGFVNGNWEILRARPKQFGDYVYPDQLTNNNVHDVRPKLTRDASRIAFVSHRESNADIFTMNIDGSALNRLTSDSAIDTMPSWSPDDSKILFVSTRNGNADLFVMDAGGANLRQLTSSTAEDIFPTWSPDGTQIAWVQIEEKARTLWVMNLDGSNPHAITSALHLLQNPAWSPNGTEIAFDFDSNSDSFNELGVINVDGSNFRRVTLANSIGIDLWINGWTAKGNALTLTYMSWHCGGGILLATTEIGYALLADNTWPEIWQFVGKNALPDHRSEDITPPQTRVMPLPKHSRARFLSPQWTGIDVGLSGIVNVDIQSRYEDGNEWFSWQYISTLDKNLYFRSQGTDDAGNVEPWPTSNQGDAQTEPFDWKLTGKVTDNRAMPLPNHQINLFPPAIGTPITNVNGNYVAYRRGASEFTFDETTNLDFGGDGTYINYIAPANNAIQNGSFESSLIETDWIFSDSTLVKLDEKIKHEILHSVRLGMDCSIPCLKMEVIESANERASHFLQMVVTTDGIIHLLGLDRDTVPVYQSRNTDGTYSQSTKPFGLILNGIMVAVPDQSNNLHVVIVKRTETGEHEIYYAERFSNSNWSSPQKIADGLNPRLLLDQQGILHVVYQCDFSTRCSPHGIYHIQRSKTANWSISKLILQASDPEIVPSNYQLTENAKNQVSVYVDNYLIQLSPAGDPVQKKQLDLPQSMTPPQILPAKDNASYLLFPAGIDVGAFIVKLNDQLIWDRDAVWISDKYGGTVLVDKQERLHLIDLSRGNYLLRDKDGLWFDPMSIKLKNNYLSILSMHVAPDSSLTLLQVLANGQAIRSQLQATQTVDAQISQTVSIPANIHKPTLSFMHEFIGPDAEHTFFEATVSDGISTTQVFSTSQSTPWKLGWADMSHWSNQTVTITFSLHQSEGDPIKALYLDQISLGSWLTAVPKSATPDQFDVGKTPQIIINGENFIATPEVLLGTTKLSSVQWIDENHIAITPPPNLSAGIYDLYVRNPGASQSVIPSAIKVGKQVYLPVISK